MQLFDSHTHMNNESYTEAQREELAAQIEASEVAYVVDVGFDLESSLMAIAHAKKYPWCYAAVGFHPHDAKDMDDASFDLIRGLAKREKVVAVGEIGLDYYRNLSSREEQQECFRRQIGLALELGMPIIIHDRDANDDVLRILKEEGVFAAARTGRFPKNPETGTADARLLLHCYSGSRELAQQYVKLGATISIAGPVTYKNARKAAETVEAVPLEHLLVETDAPYLTPEPFRGKPNSSPLVKYTAAKVAELKGVSLEATARATCENAKRFFGI
ncbi:MAG: TatD family hydrolase [Clostridiales Family XIII bacterium]|jgi:TatD DNase family protein|nr:TatD family hydrolase [Clostridiales Family XIII bacterium]